MPPIALRLPPIPTGLSSVSRRFSSVAIGFPAVQPLLATVVLGRWPEATVDIPAGAASQIPAPIGDVAPHVAESPRHTRDSTTLEALPGLAHRRPGAPPNTSFLHALAHAANFLGRSPPDAALAHLAQSLERARRRLTPDAASLHLPSPPLDPVRGGATDVTLRATLAVDIALEPTQRALPLSWWARLPVDVARRASPGAFALALGGDLPVHIAVARAGLDGLVRGRIVAVSTPLAWPIALAIPALLGPADTLPPGSPARLVGVVPRFDVSPGPIGGVPVSVPRDAAGVRPILVLSDRRRATGGEDEDPAQRQDHGGAAMRSGSDLDGPYRKHGRSFRVLRVRGLCCGVEQSQVEVSVPESPSAAETGT